MAGEEPRVAQAYIDIQARKGDRFREQVRTIGEEYGHEAGGAGGKGFDTEFAKQTTGPTSRRHRQEEGRQLGDVLGTALGATAGRHAAALTRAAMKVELRAAAREAGIAERAAAVQARAAEREAKQAQRTLAAEARAAARQVKAAERAAVQAEAAYKARMARIQSLGDKVAGGISRPLVGGSGIVGRLTSVAGVGATAASLSGLGSVTAGTVSAVTALSGLAGPLGAGLAAAGVGAGTLAIGLHGVSDAIADSGDLDKFNEDIKGLSPNARDFARTVRGLRGDLGDLKNSVQDGLFAGLDDDVQNLADRYLPLAERGLTRVSRALNGGARDIAAFLDTKGAQNQVSGIFDDIGASAEKLRPAIQPATRAFLDFIDAGSDELPGIADDITNLSNRFSTFISDAKDSGDLKTFFQGGVDAAGDLLDVGKNVGRVFGGLFSAGATGDSSGLKTLADITDRIADQVNKPEFQAGLKDFFGAIRDAGDSVGDSLPDVADALVALEPAAAKFVRGSGTALADIMEDAASAAEDLAPFLNSLGTAFQSVAPHAGELLTAFLLLKGGLLGLKVADSLLTGYDTLAGRLDRVGTAAKNAKSGLGGVRGVVGGLGAATAVVGVAALADALGGLVGQIGVTKQPTDDLTTALQGLGSTGKLGKAGLDLFGQGVGPFHRDAKDAADALDQFSVAADTAFGNSISSRVDRALDFGGSLGRIQSLAKQLDPALQNLAKTQEDVSVKAFERFSTSLIDAGASVEDIQALFPGFSSRLRDAGLTVDDATGKVVVLSGALKGLPASKTVRVNAEGMTDATARAYALSQLLRRLPTNKVVTVTTVFHKVGREPGSFGNGLGVYATPKDGGFVDRASGLRKADGGYLNPRLGAPRQDNIPLLVSGGEFVMNAYATSQPGVLDLLRRINTENRLPKSLATGGVASAAAVGISDLSASRTRRQDIRVDVPVRDSAPSTARLHPDDIAALGRVLAGAVREQKVVLSTGELTGAVMRQAGRQW